MFVTTTTTAMGPQPDDSSTASSDFFSPISISFFNQQQRARKGAASSAERGLPPLHDSSWIGARLSPIGSFDRETQHSEDDDDDDDNDEERQNDANKENRRKKSAAADALHLRGSTSGEGMVSSRSNTTTSTLPNAHFVVLANEQTSLLGSRSNSIPFTRNQGSSSTNSPFNSSNKTAVSANHASKIHPLWNSPPSNNDNANSGNEPRGRAATMAARVRQRLRPYCTLGMFLSIVSGLHLCAMGGYDLRGWWYHEHDQQQEQDRETAWMLPWGIPPQSTLLRFGALAPNYYYGDTSASQPFYAYYFYRYLGVVTSLAVCTSVAEWLLVAAAWRLLHISSRVRKTHPSWYEFGAMFLASAWTGQLWMFAFDSTGNLVIGTVAMGTCGALCAVGMARPLHRFELFVLATLFVFVALFQRPCGSVWGTTGSAFIGWALGAAGMVEHPIAYSGVNENDRHGLPFITFVGTGLSLLIILFPVFTLAFQGY